MNEKKIRYLDPRDEGHQAFAKRVSALGQQGLMEMFPKSDRLSEQSRSPKGQALFDEVTALALSIFKDLETPISDRYLKDIIRAALKMSDSYILKKSHFEVVEGLFIILVPNPIYQAPGKENANRGIVAAADLSLEGRLEKILKVADTLSDSIPKDRHNVKTVKFYSAENNRDVEVRYFSQDSYHRTKTEDFLERIDFLAKVAKSAAPKEAVKIEKIKQKYLAMAKKQLQLDIDPNTKIPRNFDAVIEEVGKLLSRYQHRLIRAAYTGNESFGKKVKAFKAAAKQKVIDDGRPIIVHVFPDDSISAHFPKGDKTYPGDYRKDRTPGINPNSVLDVVAHRMKAGSVDIKSVGSRAASYSVFDMDKNSEERSQRHELNIKNIKQDIIDRLQLENRSLKDGQVIEITSFSLLTPLKKIAEVVGIVIKPTYESETRQLRDHHAALVALEGREITVNGVKVKLSFNHMNFSVKNRKKFFEGSETVVHNELLSEINEVGFDKYVKNQKKSLDIQVEINKNSPYRELIENAKNLQEKYFYETCRLYYSGEYKKTHDQAFHFVTQMIRAEQLRGVLISWNCKTSKDRSGWLSDYLKTYIDMENYQGSDFDFNQRLKENHEFGASLEATGKNAPGARGNRENDPTGQDKSKMDSRTSALSKINVSRVAPKDNYDLRVGDSGPAQEPKRIYVYESSNNRFEQVVGIALEKTNFSKKHTIYEGETQVNYRAPAGEEPEGDVLWKIIQFAMDKFNITDPKDLQFEGSLKEKAEAEIIRRTMVSQEKTERGLEIKAPAPLESKTSTAQRNGPAKENVEDARAAYDAENKARKREYEKASPAPAALGGSAPIREGKGKSESLLRGVLEKRHENKVGGRPDRRH